jgi:Lipocalin-like domain
MRNIFIFSGLFFALLLCSCAGRKLQSNEWPLWHESGTSDWWLINSVMQSEDRSETHLVGLIMLESAEGGEFGQFYLSTWNSNDSIYHATRLVGKQNFSGGKPRFPIVFSGSDEKDALLWRFYFDDHSILISIPDSAETDHTFGHVFPRQQPFSLSPFSPKQNIWAIPHLNSTWIYNGKVERYALLKLRTFSEGLSLKSDTNIFSLIWIDLSLSNGNQLCGFFSTDRSGMISTIAMQLWNPVGKELPLGEFSFSPVAGEAWTSPASGNTYQLGYELKLLEYGYGLTIRPRMEEQEIGVSRNSFWMGAIEAEHFSTAESGGKGNMYIFNLQ